MVPDRKKRIILILACFILTSLLRGQPLSFTLKQISTNEGLPGSTVRYIEEDKNGFIWLGIEAMGACRYDGSNFVYFRSDPTSSTSLSSDYVTSIFCTDSNVVWVGTENGLNQYDAANGNFKRYIYKQEDPATKDYKINVILQNKQGQILIGSNKGLEGLNKETDKLQSFFPFPEMIDSSFKDLRVNALLQEDNDVYWLGTRRGLYLIDIKTKTYKRYLNSNTFDNYHSDWIHGMSHSEDGKSIYIATHSGLYEFNKTTKDFTLVHLGLIGREEISFAGFSNIIVDNNLIWLSSFNNGVVVINPKKKDEKLAEFNERINEVIKSKSIRHIFKTSSGKILIATRFEGIYIYDKKQLTFPHWTKTDNNGLSDNYVLSILEDASNTIWVGTKSKGLNRLNEGEGTFKKFYFLNSEGKLIESYNRIEVICQDKKGTMWLGTPAGLVRFNPVNGSYKYYEFKPLSSIFEDSKNIFWIGTISGLYIFDREREKFIKAPFDFDIFKNESYSITQVFEDFSGNIWIGTSENGLYVLNNERTTLDIYKNYIDRPWGNGGNSIRDIFQSKDSTLWIATKFDGIHNFNPTDKSFVHYTVKDGLPSNSIYFILEDQENYLWLGTEKGITKFDTKKIVFQNYDASYGLQSNSFELLANCTCHDGTMVVGGHNGFNHFNPSDIEADTGCPNLILLSIMSQDDVIARDIKGKKSLKLKYWQNFLSFDFTQIDLINARTSEFNYMLEGIDERWIKSGNIGYVSYTNLKPGHYTFKVAANHPSPLCHINPIEVSIYIKPPIWRTGWAYIFYVLLLMFVSWIVYRISTMRARYRRQEEMTQMKLSFFTNISHEFRTPITLIISSLRDIMRDDLFLKEGKQKFDLLSRNVTRLHKLINQFLDFRAIEHGVRKMELFYGDIIAFTREIFQLFSDMSHEKEIQYTFGSEKEFYKTWFDPDKIEKIMINLLSNAFKFTPSGKSVKVSVSFIKMKRLKGINLSQLVPSKHGIEHIEIKVADKGIGMNEDQKRYVFEAFHSEKENNPTGMGIGLFYIKRLIDHYKGQIKYDSTFGEGTIFTVQLPLDKTYFKDVRIHEKELDLVQYFQTIDNTLLYNPGKYTADTSASSGKYSIREGEAVKSEQSLILIVEDDNELREYLAIEMAKNYRILKAKEGVEGLALAVKHNPDLIVSDIMMPGMDGIELCENIKTNIQTSHIPVILLTAKTTLENKIEGYQTGADDYVTKPFDTPLLLVRASNLIENRKKLRNKFSSKLEFDVKDVSNNDIDKQFLDKLISYIENNLPDKDLSIENIAATMNMERTTLYKKVKVLIGKSPSQFINEVKIKNSIKLLRSGNYNISQVADMTGFSTPSYFSLTFQKICGKTPTEFLKGEL
ncbi:MAG: response regulator [Bacteroidales bacterium]|nr:response regulator [Bacteroidales bacterium]